LSVTAPHLAEGIPADVIPANFRRAARFAWGALLDAATDAERPALLDSADLLFEYVDRVSRIYFEESAAAAASAAPRGEESAARALLGRIDADQAPLPEDHQLADRIGFDLARASRAFVIAAPRRSAEYHLELAGQLRRRRALAVSEGRRVVGLAMGRSPWRELELDRSAVLAQTGAAIRGERGRNLAELRIAVDVAVGRSDRGEIRSEDFSAEMLLRRSPRIAGQIKARAFMVPSARNWRERWTCSCRTALSAAPRPPRCPCTATRCAIVYTGSRRSPGST
jgi:hypothetical protein